jgi:hypothetical protein
MPRQDAVSVKAKRPAATAAPARPAAPETGKPVAASRIIAKALWQHDFDQANPAATPEQRKENWAAARTRYLAIGKQLERRLAKDGYVIQPRDAAGRE